MLARLRAATIVLYVARAEKRYSRGAYNSRMDEIVLRALRRWPHVPSVYGWLNLDRRGRWSIKGERVANGALIDFIGRNYGCDAMGRWFFQNGPQRVFVTLAYVPFVYRTSRGRDGDLGLIAHTGVTADAPRAAWVDDAGGLLVETGLGVGAIHDQDLPEILGSLCAPGGQPLDDDATERLLAFQGGMEPSAVLLSLGGVALRLSTIRSAEVPERFGFDPDPRPTAGEPEC
jgi:hypothetical protein